MVDLMWQKFGMLTVIGRASIPPHVKDRSLWWVCKCDCGNTITTSGLYLKQGNKKSCGCFKATNGGRNKLSVTKDVSCTEMYHMRDQGMSNRDIAEKLDCSISTVYGMIGKQPKGIRAKRRTKPLPFLAPAVEKAAEEVGKSFRERCEEMLGTPKVVTVTETVVKSKADVQNRLDELVLLFGVETVRCYLRCVGYQAGTKDGMPVLTCEECLEALKRMEAC